MMIFAIRIPGLSILIATLEWLSVKFKAISLKTSPVGNIYNRANGKLYMKRDWLIKRGRLNIAARFHELHEDDCSPELHDHPWPNISIILKGGYYEVVPCEKFDKGAMLNFSAEPCKMVLRKPGTIIFRSASARHRILLAGCPAKSLFIMGKHTIRWGFYTRMGKVYWREFLGDWETPSKDEELGLPEIERVHGWVPMIENSGNIERFETSEQTGRKVA